MSQPERSASLAAVEAARTDGRLSSVSAESIVRWLTAPEYGEFRDEIAALIAAGEFEELGEAFCRTIPFGTAGQRGPTGAGPNRINSRTIRESVQGVCDYVRRVKPGRDLRAIVAFDTRRDSARFATLVAEVLAGNGLEVHLFDQPRPTPELSHAVLMLGCDVGFMVSASHNPPRDNGIKVYWDYGGQVLPGDANGIVDATKAIASIRRLAMEEARRRGLVVSVRADVDRHFRDAVLEQGMLSPASPSARQTRVVYTPLHGTGMDSIVPILAELGWREGENLLIVPSQRDPDPEFRGVPGGIPNPENPLSLGAGIDLARETSSDLVIASDPDADRLAAAVPAPSGDEWFFFQGGQLSAILGWWALEAMSAQGLLNGGVMCRTVVTSPLVDAVAEGFGVEVIGNLPVGFKYVAKVIRDLDDPGRFVFGTEQSYGFVKGTYCRDKDAAIAAVLMLGLCDHLRYRGQTPIDLLRDLWRRHGYHAERATPVLMAGQAGRGRIAEIMAALRTGFPSQAAGVDVAEVWDLLTDQVIDPATGRVTRSLGWEWGEDVLVGRLATDPRSSVTVRPSGTEPSLKVYTNLRQLLPAGADLDEAARRTDGLALAIERDLLATMGVSV
jgi:phosphoglucomutase